MRGGLIITLKFSSKGMTGMNLSGQTYLRSMNRLGATTIQAIRFVNIYLVPHELSLAERGCHSV